LFSETLVQSLGSKVAPQRGTDVSQLFKSGLGTTPPPEDQCLGEHSAIKLGAPLHKARGDGNMVSSAIQNRKHSCRYSWNIWYSGHTEAPLGWIGLQSQSCQMSFFLSFCYSFLSLIPMGAASSAPTGLYKNLQDAPLRMTSPSLVGFTATSPCN